MPILEKGHNTGHVMILAETPRPDPSGAFYTVRIYDSAAEEHFSKS